MKRILFTILFLCSLPLFAQTAGDVPIYQSNKRTKAGKVGTLNLDSTLYALVTSIGTGTGDITEVNTNSPLSGGATFGAITLAIDTATGVITLYRNTFNQKYADTSTWDATKPWVLAQGFITGGIAHATASLPVIITTVGDSIHITIDTATASKTGVLKSTDWITFNGKVSTTRAINSGAGLSGGGDLSADRTLSIDTTSERVATKSERIQWTVMNFSFTIGAGDSTRFSFTPQTAVSNYRIVGLCWDVGKIGRGVLTGKINSDSTVTIYSDYETDNGKGGTGEIERINP